MDEGPKVSIATNKRSPLRNHIYEVIQLLSKTLIDRGASYQDYEDNAHVHVELMNHIYGTPRFIDGWVKSRWAEGALAQITSKLSRIAMREGELHADNWIDIAGYAILAAAILDRQTHRKPHLDMTGTTVSKPTTLAEPDLMGSSDYEEVVASQGHDFGWAMNQMQQGRPVRRISWDEHKTSIWIERNPSDHVVMRAGHGMIRFIPMPVDLVALDWELYCQP